MKNLRLLFQMSILALLFFQTSCLSIHEAIKFDEDGSGEYKYEIDMSELMSSMEGMGDLGEMFGGAQPGENEAENLDEAMSAIKEIEMDTMIRFKDLPSDVLNKLDRPELADVISMRLNMSAEKGVYEIGILGEFDKLDDIPAAFGAFDKLQEEVQQDETMDAFTEGFLGGDLFSSFWKVEKNKLVLETPPNFLNSLMNEGLGEASSDAEMASMIFNTINIVSEVELPGKVKSSTFQNSVIDGNKVTIKFDIEKAMEDPSSMTGEIKFKMPKAWKKAL